MNSENGARVTVLSNSRHGMPWTIRFLHVDDDATYSDLVATFLHLKESDLEVQTATSAKEGLQRLSETDIDCIVSDYKMPGMDGLEFLDEVHKQHPGIPFIMFTGKGPDSLAREAVSAGSMEYLEKGVDSHPFVLLAHRIRNAVESQRVEETLEKPSLCIRFSSRRYRRPSSSSTATEN